MELKIHMIELLTDVISVSQSVQRTYERRSLNLKIEKPYDDPSGYEHFYPVRYIDDSSERKQANGSHDSTAHHVSKKL